MTTPGPRPSTGTPIRSLDELGDRLQAAVAADQTTRGAPRRSTPWLTASGAFAALVVLAVLLVGVLPGPSADAVVPEASQRTVDAGTAGFAVAIGPADGTPRTVLEGRYDLGAATAEAEAELGELLGAIGGSSAAALPEGAGGGLIERLGRTTIVVAGPTAFVRSPVLAAALGGADGWVRFSLEELAGSDGSDAVPVAPADATALLEMLTGVDGPVEDLGPEDVDGVLTVRYRGTVAPDAAVDTVTAAAPDGSDGLVARAARAAVADARRIPFDVWVDEAGHVRRISSTLPVPGSGPLTVEVTYTDVGKPLEITVPDAGDVPDVTDRLRALLSG